MEETAMKITFMGAGSTVFARNVIGDCMCTECLRDSVIALYDIDAESNRLLVCCDHETLIQQSTLTCMIVLSC